MVVGIAAGIGTANVPECAGCEQAAQRQAVRQTGQRQTIRSVQPGAMAMPPEFRDDDDDSSAPYVLSAVELGQIGLKRQTPSAATFNPHKYSVGRARIAPVLRVRIHAIRTANTNGTEAATITREQVKKLVDQANLVWWPSGIEFQFDPAEDFEHRNNTALNQDSSHAGFNANLTNESWDPGTSDTSGNKAARAAVGNEFPNKIVCFFRYGTRYTWDAAAKRWTRGPATGGFSGSQAMYVAMPKSLPEKNLLAHEVGHYLTLPHTHGTNFESVAQARKAIKDWVDVHGKTTQTALDALNGDLASITDTPPDAGGRIFVNHHGEGANCAANYPVIMIDVKFNSGYAAYYKLQPDKLNVMSYFKGCHALGLHRLSPKQIERARAALLTGNRQPLLN
jgi:hypothetical protein